MHNKKEWKSLNHRIDLAITLRNDDNAISTKHRQAQFASC